MKLFEIDEFNPEQAYLIGGGDMQVCIDPLEGSGSTPNTGNINYMGFVAFIAPEKFLKLTHELDPEILRESAQHFIEKLPTVEWCISPPSLSLTDTQGWENKELGYWRVFGHEGRHRSYALKHLGYELMPVYIYPQGLRARDITDKLLTDMGQLKSERGFFESFSPDYIILNKKVYVLARSSAAAKRKAKLWRNPIPIKTIKQKTPIEGYDDLFYHWSKPV